MEFEYLEDEFDGPSDGAFSMSLDDAGQRFLDGLASRQRTGDAREIGGPVQMEKDQPEKRQREESQSRGRSWRPISDEMGEVRRFANFRAAKRELGTVSGTELHHVVEQSQASSSRSGFSLERLNTTDNLVRLPVEKHREISAFYSSKPFGFDTTVRDSLNGDSWDDQFSFGSRALDRIYKDNT